MENIGKVSTHWWSGGDFNRATQSPQQRGGIRDQGGPLSDRLSKSDQIARHLSVHSQILDARISAYDDQGGMTSLGLVESADRVAHSGGAV